MVVPSMPVGYLMGQCGQPARYQMRCLIPWKVGDDGEESCLERWLTAYMRSGRVYCIIWIFFQYEH